MSACETIRDIPVIVEHRRSCNFEPMDFDSDDDSGFPFDRSSNRRSRDPLEDIAQRHPEFAQHLQGFPRTSRGQRDQDEDEFLRRRFERPFSSGRFERFGFPFNRDDFEREPQRYYEAYPEYFKDFQKQQPQSPSYQSRSTSTQSPTYQQYPPHYSQEYQPQPKNQQQSGQQYNTDQHPSQSQSSQCTQGTQTENEEAASGITEEREGHTTRGRPIQQSNTVDLGQKQPPDEAVNDRNQRSMSAPPENKRFTTSVNIPMGGHQGQESGGPKAPTSSGSTGSTERVIPIHVEGRDDPVIPKSFSHSTSSQPQPERIFTDSPRPQPETIFGQRPEHFTQFVNREPHRFSSDWHHSPFDNRHGFADDDDFVFARAGSPSRFGHHPQQPQGYYQNPQQQHQKQEAPHQQQKVPTQQQRVPQQEPKQETEPQPKPQVQKQPLTPIEQIQAIQKDVSALLRQVEVFNGAPKDKNYLYLDEMLTRNLLKLDNIDTQGQDAIRSARKEAIKCIEKAISVLEVKAAANVAPTENKMDVEQPQENMECEVNAQPQEKMDVASPASSQEHKATEGNNSMETESANESKSQQGNQLKSGENVASIEEQTKVEEDVNKEQINLVAANQETETKQEEKKEGEEAKTEGEKKEKKKIKKKAPKEPKGDKEENQ